MTSEEYLGQVRATAWRAARYVPAERLEEVYGLIDHGEPAEGLCSLAWAIVNSRARVPQDLIESIYKYTAELTGDEFIPSSLHDFVLAEDGHR